MKSSWRTFLKWLLVLFTFAASTFVLFITSLELSPLAARFAFAAFSSVHLNVAPSLILRLADRLTLAAIVLLWVLPTAFAAGYAVSARWLSRWQWGFLSSILLLACFFWLLSRSSQGTGMRWAALVAICILFTERAASVRKHLSEASALALQSLALLILFVPIIGPLASAHKLPPEPRQLWSVALQKGTWQGMNTGSEFDSTRQLVFAGDRVVSVFDAGFAPYQGKQPMSRYRIVSLDRATGAIKNQLELIGQWGAMPFLLSNSDGNIVLANSQLQILNPNLEPVSEPLPIDHGRVNTISPDGTTLAWEKNPGTALLDATSLKPLRTLSESVPTSISSDATLSDNTSWPQKYPNDHEFITRTDANGSKLIFHAACGFRPQFLSSNRILVTGCGWIRILNNEGATVAARQDAEDAYTFAGVNQRGTRFALQASEGRGDPSHLFYERFYIYDVNSATPLATILVADLPERQSWTAFSPDGRFVAVGNPNKLSLYELP